MVGVGSNNLSLTPGTSTWQNYFAYEVLYIRYVNYANFLLAFLMIINEHTRNAIYDALQYCGYKRTISNLLKYLLRPIFILNAASSVLFVLGIADPKIEPSSESLRYHWQKWAPMLAQVVSAYLCLSYFFYFETFVQPAGIWDRIKIAVSDLLIFNWLRVLFTYAKDAVALLLLPVLLLFSIFYLLTFKCWPGLFDVQGVHSRTSKFLRLIAYLSG